MVNNESNAVVDRWFAALRALDIDTARSCWGPGAVWHLEDRNEFGGEYGIDEYLAMLGEFMAKHGEGYEFRIDDTVSHGELVVVFCGSRQPALGQTDGVMIYRVRDGVIVEGWGIGRGADSTNPW